MRLISPHSRYSIQVFEGVQDIMTDQTGHAVEVIRKRPLLAQFQQSGLHPWEEKLALETFNFTGLPDGVNPLSTLAVYDTDAEAEYQGWTEEFKEAVDARLRQQASVRQVDMIVADKPATPRPWGKYDEQSADDIVKLQSETNFDPEHIRLYESENKKRKTIIEAMSAAERGEAVNEEIVVA